MGVIYHVTLASGPALAILVIVSLLIELTILENLLTWAADGKEPTMVRQFTTNYHQADKAINYQHLPITNEC